jgi:beta-barrel assembly-enhancing protease
MTRFENRLPDETVNVSKTNPLVEVFWLLVGIIVSIASFILLLYLAGGVLARHVPFAWEVRLADTLFFQAANKAGDPRTVLLQRLADNLAKGLELPKDMRFRVRFVDDDEVNAFATLGGAISIHRGLIETMKSENELAMVIAHEMGHVINRDASDAAGGQVMVGLALLLLTPAIGVDGLQTVVGMTQNLTLMTFSRQDEAEADETAMALLARTYGHLGGAKEVFETLAAVESKYGLLMPPEVLSSHPDTKRRANIIPTWAKKLNVPESGPLKPLPADLKSQKN